MNVKVSEAALLNNILVTVIENTVYTILYTLYQVYYCFSSLAHWVYSSFYYFILKGGQGRYQKPSPLFITFEFNKYSNALLFCKQTEHEEANGTSQETTLMLKYFIKVVV